TTSWTTRCSAGSARAFRNSDAGVGFVGAPHRHTLLNLADLSVLSCGSTDTNNPTCHDTKATGEQGGTDKVGRNGPAVVRQGQAADDHARNARDPGSKAAALDPEVTTHQFVDVGRASSSCACSSGVVGHVEFAHTVVALGVEAIPARLADNAVVDEQIASR